MTRQGNALRLCWCPIPSRGSIAPATNDRTGAARTSGQGAFRATIAAWDRAYGERGRVGLGDGVVGAPPVDSVQD